MAPSAALYSLLAPYAARHSSDVRVDFAPDSKSDPTGTVEAVSRCPLSAGRSGALPPQCLDASRQTQRRLNRSIADDWEGTAPNRKNNT